MNELVLYFLGALSPVLDSINANWHDSEALTIAILACVTVMCIVVLGTLFKGVVACFTSFLRGIIR